MASDRGAAGQKRFDALEPHELAQLYRLMSRLRSRPAAPDAARTSRDRHGERHRHAANAAGQHPHRRRPDPPRRRRRRVLRRRLVMLCDISGSMEPYARAYLQFLTSAAGERPGRRGVRVRDAADAADARAELAQPRARDPARGRAAPDWSSGTRIGDALKAFNDRHGRRGMARGAVIVILSDGWERGDPTLVGREMARLAGSRTGSCGSTRAPRRAASRRVPAAWSLRCRTCDSLVSGHSLRRARRSRRRDRVRGRGACPAPEA